MRYRSLAAAMLMASAPSLAYPARADMALSQVIVDLAGSGAGRHDLEVANLGKNVMYVAVEPAQILDPGQPSQKRFEEPDPQKLGLLVTPTKLLIQPGEKKLVRLVAIQPPGEADRVFRVRIREVVGKVSAQTSALKIVVGYDVLVIQRPKIAQDGLVASREGEFLVFRNGGNTNVLLYDGKQCAQPEKNCRALDSKRVYAGSEWRLRLRSSGEINYLVDNGQRTLRKSF